MRLSPRARQLQPRVKMAMEAVRSVLASIENFVPEGASIKVRLCSADRATFRLLPALSERMKARKVNANLVIQWPRSKNDALKRLKDGDYDIALGAFLESRPNITRFPLYEERVVCLMRRGHPVAKPLLAIDDIKPFPVVNAAYTGAAGRQVIQALEQYGFDVRTIESTANFVLIPFFLLSEDTIAFTTEREALWLASIMPLTTSEISFSVPTFPVEMIVEFLSPERRLAALACRRNSRACEGAACGGLMTASFASPKYAGHSDLRKIFRLQHDR